MSIDFLPPGTPVDLDNCHREPIHTPGGVQGHGALLAATDTIVQVSANVQTVVGAPPDALLGRPLGELVPVAELRERASAPTPNLRPLRVEVGGRAADAFAYHSGGVLVVELEPVPDAAPSLTTYQEGVARSVSLLHDASSIDELLRRAASAVRGLAGFDRVWAYRFEPDDHGVIVAEDKAEGLPAFLGLHYPASDIPAQARALFLHNRLRFIHDANGEAAPLVPVVNPLTGAWLDLSDGVLRAVSPIHIQYLKNMGATASMSIALSVRNRLWGLISAHHYSGPLLVPHETRATCELIGLVCSMQLEALEQLEASERRVALGARRSKVLDRIVASERIIDGLAGDDLLAVCDAEGAAIRIDSELRLVGATPPADAVEGLLDGLGPEIAALDALGRPELADTAAGILAAPLAHQRGNHIVWFRPEYVRTVTWGAAPKSIAAGAPRLTPDGSFRTWAESVEGASRPWEPAEIESAAELRSALGTFLITRAEQLAALNAELARSNDELDAFAYVAAHDLKEPLRGIANFATFLVEDYEDALDDDGRERLATILRLSQRMASLLDTLLEYSRIGRADLELTEFTLAEAVADALDLLASRPSVTVRGGELALRGDRIRVRQLLVNLIGNAVK